MSDEPIIFDAVGVNAEIADNEPAIVAKNRAGQVLAMGMTSPVAMRLVKDLLRVLPRAVQPDRPADARTSIDFSDLPQCQEIGIGLAPELDAVVVHLRFGNEWLSLPLHAQVLQTLTGQLAQAASVLSSASHTKQ